MLRNRMHIIANWKMHGNAAHVEAWMAALHPTLQTLPDALSAVLCPPSLWVVGAVAAASAKMAVGGQDCHAEENGAFTGEISAAMLAMAGARYVILGHSERRTLMGETSAQVAAKAVAAGKAGLIPIICIGETRAEREAGMTIKVVREQLIASLPQGLPDAIIAYEPVWAIGTGLVAAAADIEAAHAAIAEAARAHQLTRDRRLPVVYGGSVNSTNAASILSLSGVDGALVGGASLDAAHFASILDAAKARITAG